MGLLQDKCYSLSNGDWRIMAIGCSTAQRMMMALAGNIDEGT